MINDVSGGLADPAMLDAVAELDVPVVLMHWRGFSDRMDELSRYGDVVDEVRSELSARIDAARMAGIPADRIVVDPGLGFAKDAEHNWQVLAHLAAFAELGHPMLIGASRKRFLGSALADASGAPRPAVERDAGTAAVSLLCAQAGVWGLRVHDVRSTSDALSVLTHWQEAVHG
jgi:dihydropteroate synthase